jgi:hypothetical protein
MNVPRQKLKALIERRNRALNAFNRWESEHPRKDPGSERIFASLGTLYALLPPDARRREEDPERRGIQTMHQMLRCLK